MTFIGEVESGRSTPNPNVLIEYGYALKALGHGRVISIMNTHYGKPTPDNLPFDMRHLRFPITYCLNEESDAKEKRNEKEKLVAILVDAIISIFEEYGEERESDGYDFIPTQPTTAPSIFFDQNTELVESSSSTEWVYSPSEMNPLLYLRLIPTKVTEGFKTTFLCKEANESRLLPMSPGCGFRYGRNEYGCYVADWDGSEGMINYFTQVFENGELWGFDSHTVNEEECKKWAGTEFGFFPIGLLVETFKKTMASYINFAQNTLKLPPPLRIVAGATAVKNFRMTPPNGMNFGGLSTFGGRVAKDNIEIVINLEDYQANQIEILKTIITEFWDACGLDINDEVFKKLRL